jgi:uncharacterized membrane protein
MRYGWILALVAVAALTFAGVAVHEWDYKNAHPYAYGPAVVIAAASAAGIVLAIAFVWFVIETMREQERGGEGAKREHEKALAAIRSRVDAGEFTETDYSEWFWFMNSYDPDAIARTRLFLLEKKLATLLGEEHFPRMPDRPWL